ncbi:hypothetical protein BGZ91_009669 [Linnemannia elongata]|nr:hypothetical protein BGZ91_009669 [Linnemannia elongata]
MDHGHDKKKSRPSNEIMDQIQDQRDYHQECALRQVMSRKRLQLSAARPYRGSWKRSRRKWKRSRSSKKNQRQQESTTSIPSGQQQPPQLQDYCPTGTYISMVIAYPVEVVNVQIVRPDPKPELEGLHCMSIDIDVDNFPKLFPSRHVEYLDKLT